MVEPVARIADCTGGRIAVGEDSMERNLNNESEIQLNLIMTQGIEKPIERLLQSGFQVFNNMDDLVH